MKIPISDRLLACCQFIRPGDRVADVGCDHGYLGIHLLTHGIASHIIASDINEGPLQSARRNAVKYGVSHAMEFHLSNGVQAIPRDFDALVCAGMGGDTMISILSAAPWLQNTHYRLILQCQSKTPMLRSYLSDTGWRIARESVLRDGKFLYTVTEALWDPSAPRLTLGECYFPPALLASANEALPEYFYRVTQGLALSAGHGDRENARVLEALKADDQFAFLWEESK